MALGLPHFCPTVSLVPRAVIRRSELIFRHRLVQRIRDQTQPLMAALQPQLGDTHVWPPYINAFNQMEQAVSGKSSLPVVQDTMFEQRAFRGRHILIAELDDKPWFSAGNLCTALNLGNSDRIVRSLVTQHKRKLQRGSRDLWMVDAIGAQRAADYCTPELAAEYREWLQRLLAERSGSEAPRVASGIWPGEQGALRDLPAQTEQLLRKQLLHTRFLMYFDPTGEMHIKAIEPDTALLNRDRLAAFIGNPERAPRATLPDILEAVSHRMKTL